MQKNLILKLIAITLQCLGQTIPFDESQYIVKDVKYDYDLVSGKVNQVTYQGGESDQLQHRYEYDGDNRITAVYTSTDGITWTKEAQYDYYAHGPLAMSKLGNNGDIEQCSYVYTLQGWIKGVKGQNFSYALGYNDTDYKPIVNSSQSTVLSTPIAQHTVNGQLVTDNLYNGNISTWASLNPKINGATAWTQQFSYDQLNRIKSGTTLAGGDNYKNTYSYDANGNLQTLERWSKTGAKMDEFVYNYEDKKSGYLANTNKLRSVDDKPEFNTLSTEDLDDQGIDNYQYDDIGNLNRDTQEDIVNIEWTVYGKVKAVNRISDPVTKLPLGNKPNLLFEYDASGNRVSKIATAKDGKVTKTFYIRDASGNVMSTYETTNTASLALSEQYLYGSSRLGMLSKGRRSYELTDHLGNVRTVVDEAKAVSSATDYYPFGMTANAYTPNGYRYGFNGQEKETSLSNSTTSAEYWMYDGRLGRRWNLDPRPQISISDYATFGNNPVRNIDPNGDTTTFYDNKGKFLFKIDDKLKNAVTVLMKENEEGFYQRAYKTYLLKDPKKRDLDKSAKDLRRYGISYDIESFAEFHKKESTKTVADKIDKETITSDMKEFEFNSKPVEKDKLYAERVGNLVYTNGLVTTGKEVGTSGDLVHSHPGYLPKELNTVGNIHTHPFAINGTLHWNHTYGGSYAKVEGGPSPADCDYAGYNKSGVRNVVVDSKFIYLINSSPNETIKIPIK